MRRFIISILAILLAAPVVVAQNDTLPEDETNLVEPEQSITSVGGVVWYVIVGLLSLAVGLALVYVLVKQRREPPPNRRS